MPVEDAVPQKFDLTKMKVTPISDDVPAQFDLSKFTVKPINDSFTANPKGEGLYRMLPSSQQGYTDTSQEIKVPYSRVQDAIGAGFQLHFDEKTRYDKDKTHEGQGPTLLERAKTGVQKALEPSTGWTGDIPILPGMDVNTGKAALRTIGGIPGYLKEVLYAAATGGQDNNARLMELIDPTRMPEQMYKQFQEDRKQYGDKIAAQNLTGTIEGLGVVALATHGAQKALPDPTINIEHPITDIRAKVSGIPEAVRGEIREVAGTWKNTRDVVTRYGKEAEKTRESNEDINKSNLEQIKQEGEKRLETLKKNKDKVANYDEAVKKTKEQNARDYRREVERQRIEGEHKSASIQLKAKVQAAFVKATKNYNASWNKWRVMVRNVKVKMNPVVDTINAQASSMNPQQQTIFRDILRESQPDKDTLSGIQLREELSQDAFGRPYDGLTPDEKAVMDIDVAQRGIDLSDPGLTEVPASRLHGWKSQLERAVRTTPDGTIRYAIGKVLQSVRALEEQASDTVPGAKDQLLASRAITGPYFDAFFKSPEDLPKAAGQMLREQTPEQVKAEAQQARVDRIAAYDPSIKSLSNHIDNLEAALKDNELNKGKTSKELAPRPKEPELEPKPEPKPLKELEKEPAVPNLQQENMQFIADKLRWYGHLGSWVLRLFFGGAFRAITHGGAAEFGEGIAIGQGAVTILTRVLRKGSALEWLARPSAEDMEMIDTLPPQDAEKLREVLGKLAEFEKNKPSKGLKPKPSPAMAAWLAGGSISQQPEKSTPPTSKITPPTPGVEPQSSVPKSPKDLKAAAQELQDSFHKGGFAPKPAQATASSNSRSGAKPYTHVFNIETGQIEAA